MSDPTITSWNPAAERLFGYSSEEIIGTAVAVMSRKDRPEEISGIHAKVRAGEHVHHVETNGQRVCGHHSSPHLARAVEDNLVNPSDHVGDARRCRTNEDRMSRPVVVRSLTVKPRKGIAHRSRMHTRRGQRISLPAAKGSLASS